MTAGESHDETVQRFRALLPADQVLDLHEAVLEFASEDVGGACPGLGCLAEELPDVPGAAIAASCMDAGPSKRGEQSDRGTIGVAVRSHDEDARLRRGDVDALPR